MTRRYARWVAVTLLLVAGCGDSPRTPIPAITEYNKGVHFADREDWDTAITCYTKAIRLKPDLVEAYENRGHAYYDKGEPDQAIKDYSEAIRLKPDYAMAYNNRGMAYGMKGEPDQAIKDFTEAIRLKPDDMPPVTDSFVEISWGGDLTKAYAYNNRGRAYYDKGEPDQAIKDYSEAIRLKPDHALAYKYRGDAYKKQGDNAKADADFAKAKELEAKK